MKKTILKKLTSIVLMLAMVLSMGMSLTACGSNKVAPDFVMPEGGYDGSEVTITFSHTMSVTTLQPTLDAFIGEFNKLYPNIHVVHSAIGGYDDVRDQISKDLTTGAQPNIAYCYPDHVALYNVSKGVQTLDTLIESDIVEERADGSTETIGLTAEQKADFIKGYYDEGKQFGDGKMYTLPFSKSTEVLYYNVDFFTKHNLTPPTTWDEMEALCRKIKTIDNNCIPLGYDSEANWFITMCEQLNSPYTSATGDHYLFNNNTNKDFVKKFRNWYQEGLVTTQTILDAYTSSLFVAYATKNEANPTYSVMSIGSSAGATHQRPEKIDGAYPFEVGIVPIPQANENNKKVISQGPSVCIFKKENPQEVLASWLFVKYLTTSTAFQAAFSNASGYVPVLKSVSSDPTYAANLAKANGGDYIAYLSAKVCLEQESYYYASPAFNGSSVARDQVGSLLVKCLALSDDNLDAAIDKAFKDAIDECEY